MHAVIRILLFACCLGAIASPGLAQDRDLSEVSIEDLMNIEITSASRKEQRTADVAAAVFVITHEDIHRSGMTTVPDLLRLAPGVEVAQINSNKWAVSVRGFNGLYANKLLMLVDGRSVYNRFFSGVYWDALDLVVDDIDRIEVIRGPGAASWGANAVNGVINIVTKASADTQGGLVRLESGRSGEQAALRYGGTFGATHYRLYSQWAGRNQSLIAPGTRADDASQNVTAGFRLDRSVGRDGWMLEGALAAGRARSLYANFNPETIAREPYDDDPSNLRGGHLLGRWTHTRAGGASLQIQSAVDIAHRQESVGDYDRHALDVDTQYHTAVGTGQDLVAGAGYRFVDERFAGNVGFSLIPPKSVSSLVTGFLQDEIALFGHRLAVTLGSQVQYDSEVGAGVQPTARAIWTGLPRQRLWAATSRALRTPSLYERGIHVELPPTQSEGGLPLSVLVLSNPDLKTETVSEAEAGYRVQVGSTASIDVTGFVGHYNRLQTQETAAPSVVLIPAPHVIVPTQFGNLLDATTRGLEIAGRWTPSPVWQLDGSYTAFHLTPHAAATSQDLAAAITDGSAPRVQWQLGSTFSPDARATVHLAMFRVGPLERLGVDGYLRADANGEWRFTKDLSVMLIGQNLFDPSHAEFSGTPSALLATQVPRSASVRLRWAFR